MNEFMGRTDLVSRECPECHGDGRDPKKKKRVCPVCRGSGAVGFCPQCKKPAHRGCEDASGKLRISEENVCRCEVFYGKLL